MEPEIQPSLDLLISQEPHTLQWLSNHQRLPSDFELQSLVPPSFVYEDSKQFRQSLLPPGDQSRHPIRPLSGESRDNQIVLGGADVTEPLMTSGGMHENNPFFVTEAPSGLQRPPSLLEKPLPIPDDIRTEDLDEIIEDYMCANILVCLCCCCPIGILGIWQSYECQKAKAVDNYQKARKYSKSAGLACKLAVLIGIIILVLNIVLFILVRKYVRFE